MGVRRGNRNKNKGSGLKAQDFLKTELNDTNNDLTENSSPQTINSSTNSQPTNPSKRIRLAVISDEEEEEYELQNEFNKLKENIKIVRKS